MTAKASDGYALGNRLIGRDARVLHKVDEPLHLFLDEGQVFVEHALDVVRQFVRGAGQFPERRAHTASVLRHAPKLLAGFFQGGLGEEKEEKAKSQTQ